MAAPIDMLYEDANLLVINKPAGIPVHAGPKGGPNIEQMVQALYDPRRRPPHLAHRLDRDTSGCLVFGRTQPALRRLNHLFATRQAKKIYWAVTQGMPAKAEGLIDAKLAKKSTDPRSWWMEIREDGQEAQTRYRVLAQADGRALIECAPVTGRTHQIRVHLAHIGCPILGDDLYGPKSEEYSPLLLHARAITLPFEGPAPVHVEAPPPAVFQAALKRFTLNA